MKGQEGLREVRYLSISDDENHTNLESEPQRYFQVLIEKFKGEVDPIHEWIQVNLETLFASEEEGIRELFPIQSSKLHGVGLIHRSCTSLLEEGLKEFFHHEDGVDVLNLWKGNLIKVLWELDGW